MSKALDIATFLMGSLQNETQVNALINAELSTLDNTYRTDVEAAAEMLSITSLINGLIDDTGLTQLSNVGDQSSIKIGNLILKWGLSTSTTDGDEVYTFDTAFENYCSLVLTQRIAPNGTVVLPVEAVSATTFTVDRSFNSEVDTNFYWIAIGG